MNPLPYLILFALPVTLSFHWRHRSGYYDPPSLPNGVKVPKAQWFTQRLDHFDQQNEATWKQRYFVNDTFWKKGGPIFLMLGGEGPSSPVWNVVGSWVDYAAQYGALAIQVEHRFYGESHPTKDTTLESLRYLSSEQALADFAYFRQSMAVELGTGDAPWIVFGGSYSGALSAWIRLKYPNLFFGSIASSAPIEAKLNFVEYAEVVTASLATSSSACVDAVKKATIAFDALVKTTAGRASLSKQFKLCSPLQDDENDIANFAEGAAGNFFGVVQYNKDNRAFAVGTNITIDTLCSIMADTSVGDELARYAAVNTLMLKTYKVPCLDVNYTAMIEEMRNTTMANEVIAGRMWFYQTCTEFGYYQTSDSPNQPFGTLFPLSFAVQQCVDVFGKDFNQDFIQKGIDWTNENYGSLGINKTTSRTLFPNGSIDPWHALGLTHVMDILKDVNSIFIEGTAHCANMYPPLASDPPGLKDARSTVMQAIGLWVLQAEAGH